MERLILDGNAFYEIDETCLEKKKRNIAQTKGKETVENHERNPKQEESSPS